MKRPSGKRLSGEKTGGGRPRGEETDGEKTGRERPVTDFPHLICVKMPSKCLLVIIVVNPF